MDDVIVIGGSFAGLTAALQLGRARRKVVVLDSGLPRNRFAAHAHGVLGHDGSSPGEILRKGRDQLAAYPSVRLVKATATSAGGKADAFSVTTEDGETLNARRLILSYGITDNFPAIPGFAECWGKSVLHCPYCHGFEVADQRLGLLYGSPLSLHMPSLLMDWTGDLTLFADGHDIPGVERQKFDQRGVKLVEARVAAFEHDNGQLSSIVLADGKSVPLDALFAHPRNAPAASLHDQLGVQTVETPLGLAIKLIDQFQTSVPGIYAGGDAASAMHSIPLALSSGSMAGVACHRSMLV
jgi:thioredoxin reductase